VGFFISIFFYFQKVYYLYQKNKDMERFSMKEVIKQKFGESEKNTKTAKSTKRVEKKGNYTVKIVDGVKYFVLK
jgi:hypothetical protein